MLFVRSPRSLSPAYKAGGAYDDIDDYSPVVSDIEDQNEDDIDSKVKSKRKDDLDNCDILQRILKEQSSSKCELEEGDNSDQGEHDEAEEVKESKYFAWLKFQTTKLNFFSICRERDRTKVIGHIRKEESGEIGTKHFMQCIVSLKTIVNKRIM